MNCTSTISSPDSSCILDYLSLITPEKIHWWSRADKNILVVDLQSPVNLRGFGVVNDADLLGDIDITLSAIKKRFSLGNVMVSGLKDYRGIYAGRLQRSSFNGIVLSAAETGRLYEVLSGESFENIRYIHVLFDTKTLHSIARVKAPGDARVKDVLLFLAGKMDGFGEDSNIFNPLSREKLNPEEFIGTRTDLIAVTDEIKRLDSTAAGILSRPSSRKKLSFRKISDSLDTRNACCNCLSCAAICPAGLSPSILFHFAESGAEDLDSLGADLCFQCGLCSFVCPSNIPLSAGIGGIHADAT